MINMYEWIDVNNAIKRILKRLFLCKDVYILSVTPAEKRDEYIDILFERIEPEIKFNAAADYISYSLSYEDIINDVEDNERKNKSLEERVAELENIVNVSIRNDLDSLIESVFDKKNKKKKVVMKKEKCKYCDDESDEDGVLIIEDSYCRRSVFVDEKYKELDICIKNMETYECIDSEIPITYCPFCGRKL